MQATLSLQSWLDQLRSLAPVTGVVHVGAGAGQDAARYAHWNVPSAVLIEAEESCHDKLTAVASGLPGWSVHTELLSDQEEQKDFYLASNSNENGILPPECLTSLWRNLKTKEQRRLNATTLNSLLTELNPDSESINWVVIDCLPALPVLRGAGQRLDDWDVIIARVILDQAQLHTAGASKAEVDSLLSEHGYRCIACEEERQPAVGRALYVRDWKTSLHARLHCLQRDAAIQAEARTQLQKSLDEQIPLLAERHQQVEVLTKTSEEQTKLVTELQEQLEQLTKAKDEQTKLAAERQQQVVQRTKACEEQTKLAAEQTRLAAERQQQVALLTKASEEQAKLAAERQAQMQQLTQERDTQSKLTDEKTRQLEQLTQAKAEQEQLAAKRKQQVQQLTQERDAQTKLRDETARQLEQLSQAKAEQEKWAAKDMPSLSKGIEEINEYIKTQKTVLETVLKTQADEFIRARKMLDSGLKKGLINVAKQIEAFLDVQHYLSTGEITGDMHGFPISPDFARYLIELLETNDYDLIVEFGSGVSTVIMAKTLAKIAPRRQDKPKTRQVAFEHIEHYHEETLAKLKQSGLDEAVQLALAPLQPYTAPAGGVYQYYSCQKVLQDIGSHPISAQYKVLLLIDGPPGKIGKHARYPGLPIALDYLEYDKLDIVLDDYNRPDEQEVVENWIADLKSLNLAFTTTILQFEKGAAVITVSKQSGRT